MNRTLHKLRLEADSTTAGDVPANTDFPAGYLDGGYVTVPALRARFPHKRIIAITVNGSTPHADVIDQEAGDVNPPTAARYVATERAQHGWPTIYFPLSNIAAVCKALTAVGLGPDVPLWTAHYTGKPHICGAACLKDYEPLPFKPLIVATQYADPTTSGGHFDLSLVVAYWPGVDPKPAPKATPLFPATADAAHTFVTNISGRSNPTDAAGNHVLDQVIAEATRVRRLTP